MNSQVLDDIGVPDAIQDTTLLSEELDVPLANQGGLEQLGSTEELITLGHTDHPRAVGATA